MKRFLKWSLVGVVLICFLLLIIRFLLGPEDACLDSGGCWDYVNKVCRKTEPNAQEFCNSSGTK